MIRPGPANHIIDVPGINIGHAHDSTMITGVSVVLPDRPAVASVAVSYTHLTLPTTPYV